jgi:hypothetical protein
MVYAVKEELAQMDIGKMKEMRVKRVRATMVAV